MNETTNNDTTNPIILYANYLQDQNKAENTVKSYVHDIGLFFEYFNLSPTTITREQIKEYNKYLEKTKKNNAKSINRSLSALKSYNEFLVKEGLQDSVMILSTDYISIQKQNISPTKTNIKEITKFMDKIQKNECPRNYYIVRLLLNSGLRISEELNIELDDINFKKESLRVIGKGSKQRIIPLNKTAIEIIKLAIEDRKNYKYAVEIMNSPYLFLSNKGGKLESCTIERIFNKYSNVITPHSCRHMFATNYLENGNRMDVLQMILGHSNPRTTMIYNHPSQSKIMESVNNCCI
jgi:integrase/recombinase XerD